MINRIARRRMALMLESYFSCKINNYQLDNWLGLFSNCNDLLVASLCGAIYLLYDDVTKHWWFKFYDEKVQTLISVWMLLLNSNIDFCSAQIPPLKDDLSDFWPLASADELLKIERCANNFKEFYPPITNALLEKLHSICWTRIRLFEKLKTTSIAKKVWHLIKIRNPNTCQELWREHSRLDSERLFCNIIPLPISQIIIPNDTIGILKLFSEEQSSIFEKHQNICVWKYLMRDCNSPLVNNNSHRI
ncbi:MAG: hypothetical protein AB7F40_00340 [Victivallaceae bacterium]|nr:hypothetical protein [Victivallaceae bacterium]